MKLAQVVRAHAYLSLIAAIACSDDEGQSDDNVNTSGSGGAADTAGTSASGGTGGASGSGTAATAGRGGSSAAASGTGGSGGRSGGASGSGGTGTSGGASAGTGGSTASSAGAGGADGNSSAGGSGGSGGGSAAGSGGAGGSAGSTGSEASGSASPMMNFFVTSSTSMTAELGGLSGADMRCQTLAEAVGAGSKTWRAYLSAENPATNAADRIGSGPYFNAKGMMLAADKAALHARGGDADLFLTEKGEKINGQWAGSPRPNEHDILTGTQRDGTLAAGLTCGDWTSADGNSQVGHSDGFGPNMATTGMFSFWNSVHTGDCGNTAPGGGAGRFYCFVAP